MKWLLGFYPGEDAALVLASVLMQAIAISSGACLATKLLARRNAALRSALCLAALVVILCSPAVAMVTRETRLVTFEIPTVSVAASTRPAAGGAARPSGAGTRKPAAKKPTKRVSPTPTAENATAPRPSAGVGTVTSAPDRTTRAELAIAAALLVWGAGVLFLLLRTIHGWLVLLSVRRDLNPWDSEGSSGARARVRSALGVGRLPPVVTSEAVAKPIVAGLMRPKVVLPADLARTLPRSELVEVLLHECAHVVHRHHVVRLLQKLAGALLWPLPTVHLLNRYLSAAQEEVCDNHVLRHSEPAHYANTLVEIAMKGRTFRRLPATACLIRPRRRMEKRIRSILDEKRKPVTKTSPVGLVSIAAVFLAAAVSVAGGRAARAQGASSGILSEEKRNRVERLLRRMASNVWKEREEAAKNMRALLKESKEDKNALVRHLLRLRERTRGAELKQRLESVLDRYLRPWKYYVKSHTLKRHGDVIFSLKFSPDGKMLASCGDDGTVRIWDPKTGGCLRKMRLGAHAQAWCVAFSPDGKRLACGGRTWNGKELADVVKIWNPKTGALLKTLEGHSEAVLALAFSPDGKMLVSGGVDKTVRVWDTRTYKCLRTLETEDHVESFAFSPDGGMLAFGVQDGYIMIWDMRARRRSRTGLPPHTELPKKAAKKPRLRKIEADMSNVRSLAFSPDGKTLVSAGDISVKVWNPYTGKQLPSPNVEDNGNSAVFSPDGRMLVSAGLSDNDSNRVVRIWDPRTGELLHTLEEKGHSESIVMYAKPVAFSPDGGMLASTGWNGTVIIWSLRDE